MLIKGSLKQRSLLDWKISRSSLKKGCRTKRMHPFLARNHSPFDFDKGILIGCNPKKIHVNFYKSSFERSRMTSVIRRLSIEHKKTGLTLSGYSIKILSVASRAGLVNKSTSTKKYGHSDFMEV